MRVRLATESATPIGFACVILDQPHSNKRAKWPETGWWSEVCTRHMEIWQANVAASRNRRNPLWFIGRKETRQ